MKNYWQIWKHSLGAFDEEDGYNPDSENAIAVIRTIIVGINIGAVAEAIILCEKSGVDPKKLIKALKGGFADSLVLRNHGIRMIEKDFIPRGKNSTHLKDMVNILEQANKNDLDLPISKIIKLMFENLCKSGFSNDDHSSLYNEILKNSGAHSQN